MTGPYMNSDGDWWVPVADVPSFAAARAQILGCLSYEIPEEGTLVYKGKAQTIVDDVHTGEDVGPECEGDCSRRVLAYHFEENRRW